LRNNRTLVDLGLSRNKIGDGGATAIAEALIINSTLQRLRLSMNPIGNDGATAMAMAVRSTRTLRQLELSDNNIGIDGDLSLIEALTGNIDSRLEILWVHKRNIVHEVTRGIP